MLGVGLLPSSRAIEFDVVPWRLDVMLNSEGVLELLVLSISGTMISTQDLTVYSRFQKSIFEESDWSQRTDRVPLGT